MMPPRLPQWFKLKPGLAYPSDLSQAFHQRLAESGHALTVRLVLCTTGLILLGIGSITWLSICREQEAFKVELEQQAELMLDMLSAATADWLHLLDIEHLSGLMESIGEENPLLIQSYIYDAEGRILADSSKSKQLLGFDDYGRRFAHSNVTQYEWQPNALIARRGIIAGHQPLGGISVTLSTAPLEYKLKGVRDRGIVVALIVAFSGISLSLIISRSITRPLRIIMAATQKIAAGDLSERISIQGRNEFSVLADAFNEMTEKLQQTLTEQDWARQALRESEERYALAVLGANDGLWDWNLRTSDIYFSPRWKAILGYQADELSNQLHEWFDRVHPEDTDQLKSAIADLLQNRTQHLQVEYRMRHQKGHYLWILSRGVAVRDPQQAPYRLAGSQTDITVRKEAEFRLFHEAFHDSLTGLANRAMLLKRLSDALRRSHDDAEFQFAVLFLDFDRFKVINDSLGHTIGDDLLIHIARRLEHSLRGTDLVARLGGDEFIILLEGIHHTTDATDLADRIQDQLRRSFNLSGHNIITTASIGIVLCDSRYSSPDDILRDADISMYRAKEHGKAQYALFHPDMHKGTLDRLKSENDLRDAIENQDFTLHYQPIVDLKTGFMTGVEALIRWHHRSQGWIPPSNFIPLAEETGLIVKLGEWVLHEACRQAHCWATEIHQPTYLFSISVNLSSNQISQPDLIEIIVRLLDQVQIPPSSLKIEITESVIMENLEVACSKLEALKEMGIQIYIDDFGTGYSSLGYLQKLPVDALKIDRTFVSKIGQDRGSEEIVRAIIMLAKGLDMSVIAEGVETIEQEIWLKNLECDYAQGFLYCPAQDSKCLTTLYGRSLSGKSV